jgi:16S rRNA C967 or C1407 C5-methylase (RsmB/RsmF family)/NOL1/NOP2/fmu family ribosome biogenesis protein
LYPFPEPFIKRIELQLNDDATAFLEALCGSPVISVRKNAQKPTEAWTDMETVAWCAEGRYLSQKPVYTLDPLFHAGCYYPQEASSMMLDWVLRSLNPVSEQLVVLDLCAAPGGKSTVIASWLQGKGVLVCNEIVKSRSLILLENMIKWGTPNCVVTRNAPADFTKLDALFDIIVVDAPCSGEGLFRKDTRAIDGWSEASAAGCAVRQRDILDAVWAALKPDGIVIYSTCTFNPTENEKNIQDFAEHYNAEILPLNIPEQWGVVAIDIGAGNGLSFYPHRTRGEGFFIAAIRKGREEESDKIKTSAKDRFIKVSRNNSFASLLKPQTEWIFFEDKESIRAFSATCAKELYRIRQSLNILEYGILLGEQSKKGFAPAHNLAMSTAFINNSSFPEIELELPLALKYLKGETLPPFDSPKGFTVLKHKGVILGFGKNAGTRINNLYPDRWRIRMSI